MPKRILIMIIALVALFSCTKEEGPGGTASISGKVYVKYYNYNFTSVIGEFYAQDEDVFIVYGNDSIPNDECKTGYNGDFRFDYLQKGTYTIYVYSKDTTALVPTASLVEKRVVEISEKGQKVVLEDIIIADN